MKIINWIKGNKLSSILILILIYFLVRNLRYFSLLSLPILSEGGSGSELAKLAPSATYDSAISSIGREVSKEYAPQTNVEERLVVEESNISLVVKDVRSVVDSILDYVNEKEGYMVSSTISQPEEVPNATLVVRIPSEQLRPTLAYLRSQALKVTYEYLTGKDVTDQYLDLQARLDTYSKTKAKYEEILAKAVTVSEIMQVQQQIISLQTQIDSLKGQQQYLEKTAENAKLSIYLSTDEFSLPYAPKDQSFRPAVIFKLAVRSLVRTCRWLGTKLIWLGVYSVVWIPLLVIAWWWKKRKSLKL